MLERLAYCAHREHNCALNEYNFPSPAPVGRVSPSAARAALAPPDGGLSSAGDRAADRRPCRYGKPGVAPIPRSRPRHAAANWQPSPLPGRPWLHCVRGAGGHPAKDDWNGRRIARRPLSSGGEDHPRLHLRLGREGHGGSLQRCGLDDRRHPFVRGDGGRDPAAANDTGTPHQPGDPAACRIRRKAHRGRRLRESRPCRTEDHADRIAR